ncbi:16947_t:CDS:2 [Funneliformis geosporum]|uniref:glucan endo-1,3-beta-D-glucosidase n=1 Tax=Funneliformis geosporum TaxID=1117311 RepID=A0A9W4WM11_9GLOM|nr:16947_t:CDS:2 [Funneliformis geosporum]CAI2163920.1 16768_t:CDS:2 [Funneliformis geosporum]
MLPILVLSLFFYISSVFSYRIGNLMPRMASSPLLPISTDAPPALFVSKPHPQPPRRLDPKFAKSIPTNKFYTNLLVDTDANPNPVFPLPYALRFESNPNDALNGFSISNIDEDKKVLGSDPNADPVEFFFSIYTPSITISANELPDLPQLILSEPDDFSIVATLTLSSDQNIVIPIVRGMAFVTAIYKNLTPLFFTGVGFTSLSSPIKVGSFQQFTVVLKDESTWLIYANGNTEIALTLTNGQIVCGSGPFEGIIQIAKVPKDNIDQAIGIYSNSAGIYATSAVLDVQNDGITGTYAFNWKVSGDLTKPLLHFALPHQVSSLTPGANITTISLTSPAKGQMIALTGISWSFAEPVLNNIGILPTDFESRLTDEKKALIVQQTPLDVAQDFTKLSNLDSMYFSGKVLAKFALVCLVANDVIKDPTLTTTCVNQLKDAIQPFVTNQRTIPLRYDSSWKGIIIDQDDPAADFGASFYNDHHFHYGYFVYAAAILRHLDELWGQQNEGWVEALIRDVSNPSADDTFFPTFRNFDWFSGHSWASGIFSSGDGNNEESTSEDYNFFYGMKLWGQVSKKPNIESLADVILAVEARSMRTYFLMEDDNNVQPIKFIKNKVTGILFENKADHTTFFSKEIDAIQGIQMIPVTPIMPYIRSKKFITEEFNQIFAPIVDGLTGNFQSLIEMNRAIIDPDAAFDHFANNINATLDDGLSRSWALFWCAVQTI